MPTSTQTTFALLATLTLVGCGDDAVSRNQGGAGNSGDTSGTSGTAGAGGVAAGAAGTAGTAGTAGAAGAGASGAGASGAAGAGATGGSAGTSGSSGANGTGGASGSAGTGGSSVRPDKPAALVSYLSGNDDDSDVVPTGPGVILMGGGADVDDAFVWWKPYIAGGDVVVLRTTGADGYNSYLYQDIGGCDSVETLLVTDTTLAADPYVIWTVAHAEGIFLTGGDQAQYLESWKGTPLADALMTAYHRGAVVGGTSAGCAVLGELMFAAYNDTVYSDEALADPYNQYMTMERGFLDIPLLSGVITDTHFVTRDRMGRLVTFVGRLVQDGWASEPLGIGIDENTAVVVGPDGHGQVLGGGAAYLVRSNGLPTTCAPGVALEYAELGLTKLVAGDSVQLPQGTTSVTSGAISASMGAITPTNPY